MSIQAIFFTLITITVFYLAFRRYRRVARIIYLGKNEEISGHRKLRWRNVLLVAFGQQKMFKRWLPALFHGFIYVAFLLTQIELIEIFIDGFSGRHRFFSNKLGALYPLVLNLIELLSVLAFIATLIFLARRNLLKVKRFWKPEMKGWPFLDANLILIGEILLILGIMTMNGADQVLQSLEPAHYRPTGTLWMSASLVSPLIHNLSVGTLEILERSGWWLHILVVYGFLLYLPYSKHLHILLAFPNTYYSRLKPRGRMDNIPEITRELKSMLGLASDEGEQPSTEIPEFGASDIDQLSWKSIMDAYTCTECGRCTSVCPANLTGKKLSPRKILMDIRDRAEEIYTRLESKDAKYLKAEAKDQPLSLANFNDGENLFNRISDEEIWACTTCNACVEACPVMIDPLDPILQMRRYKILNESSGPPDWLPMFNSLESGGSVWQVSEDRESWYKRV
ncbi:MAG: (Fe-S)-binding protein [Saprospiraceae bacterium]|nr:(Fe-S)-binding protein [Saprospiraceae bacterium]